MDRKKGDPANRISYLTGLKHSPPLLVKFTVPTRDTLQIKRKATNKKETLQTKKKRCKQKRNAANNKKRNAANRKREPLQI